MSWLKRANDEDASKAQQPQREARDESAVRVDDTCSRERSQESCPEQAEKTPPISLIGPSTKCRIGRVESPGNEAFGQQMQRRLQELGVAKNSINQTVGIADSTTSCVPLRGQCMVMTVW